MTPWQVADVPVHTVSLLSLMYFRYGHFAKIYLSSEGHPVPMLQRSWNTRFCPLFHHCVGYSLSDVKAAYTASQRPGVLMTPSMVTYGTEVPGSCCSSILDCSRGLDALADFRGDCWHTGGSTCEPLVAGLEPKFLTVPLGVGFASSDFRILSCRVTL